MKTRRTLYLIVLALFLIGCSTSIAKDNPLPTVMPLPQQEVADPTVAPAPDEGEAVVAAAIADLQGRLGTTIEIAVQEVTPTDFSDTSLGVPKPGQAYAQVLTPGYVIRLAAGGQAYVYHGNSGREVLTAQETGEANALPGNQPAPVTGGLAVSGQEPETGWRLLQDEAYGYQIALPEGWMWMEMPTRGPGVPNDWPAMRFVQLYPEEWDAQVNRSGPPDPTAKPVVAPLQIEVVVGPPEQFRRVYPEPSQSTTVEIDGLPVTAERDVYEAMTMTRYVAVHPGSPELYVVISDQMTGFSDRVKGNESIANLVPRIIQTLSLGSLGD
jgi:hypothetical protein